MKRYFTKSSNETVHKRSILLAFFVFFIALNGYSVNRYWVGGSGKWDDPAKWSETDGGAGGASVPISVDDVFFTTLSGFNANNRTVTLPIGPSNLARNITIKTELNPSLIFTGTGRLDIYGSVALEDNMTFTNWTGNMHFYMGVIDGTNTINTANNIFYNTLIRFENNFSGDFVVNGEFKHAFNKDGKIEIELVGKVNTIAFNDLVVVSGNMILMSGTAILNKGFDQSGTSSIITIHNNTIFHSYSSGAVYRFANYGEAYLHGQVYSFGEVLGGSTASPTAPQVLDIEDCTINMTMSGAYWKWGKGLPNTFKSNNSVINFSSDAAEFYPFSLEFNVVNIEASASYGKDYFTIAFEGTNPASATYTPSFNHLNIYNNCLFRITGKGFNPRIKNTLHFEKEHSYFTDLEDNVTLGNTFYIEMLSGSKLDMQATCTKPIWLNKMSFHFNPSVTILADNIISTNIFASGSSTPYNIGANSYIMPYTTHVGWNIGTPNHRNLVWVGPIPKDTNDEQTYAIWGDENNWRDLAIDPSAISGPGYTAGTPVCPPTHVDSVVFPNNSYVLCDANISYTEGMNWLGNGRIFGNDKQEIEVWGSLHLSKQMRNDFQGTFWFRSDRPYRCHITTNNQEFDRGVVFNSADGNGSWELKDTLKVPIVDGDAGFSNNSASFKLLSGHFHSGDATCTQGNGHTILVYGMYLGGGSIHLYDSDVYVYGHASVTGKNYVATAGVSIHAGTSHIYFSDVLNPNDYAIPRIDLGPNHKYFDITIDVPSVGVYASRTHFVNINNNVIHHLNIEPNTSILFGGSGINQIKKINALSDRKTFLCATSNNNPTYNNNNQMIVDSLISKGPIDFGHFTRILSYIELSPSYTYNLGTSTSGSTAITLSLYGASANILHPSYTCSNKSYSYLGAHAVFPGTCSNPIMINNGQIQVSSPISVQATYVTVNNNTAYGQYIPIVNLGGILLGNTSGWVGSDPAPRKLRWVDVSNNENNIGNWNDEDYWEQVLPVYQSAPQCPPTRIDTALFDDQSFSALAQKVNIDLPTQAEVASMYWENISEWVAPELISKSSQVLHIFANLSFYSNMKQNFSGVVIFRGIPTPEYPAFKIYTANKEFNNHIRFQGDSDNTLWYVMDTIHMPSKILYLDRGNLHTQGHGINIAKFISNSSDKRFIDISNSVVTVRASTDNVWDVGGGVTDGVVTLFNINSDNSIIHNIAHGIASFSLGGRKYNVIKSTSGSVRINPSQFRRDTINHLIDAPGGITSYESVINVNSIYVKKAEFNRPVNINSSPGYYDTVYFAQNATFSTNNKYFSHVYFPPGKTYTFNVGTVQWFENDCQVDLVGTINNNIQFYSNSTAETAFLRKDSGFFCADYINMRDITAVGNGQNPLSCTSFGEPVSTVCQPETPNSWIVSACDTITDLSSSCGPWVIFDTNRGRADFNAGENADLQGNVHGWAKRDYGTLPYVTLTDYAPVSICQGEKVPITYQITGQLPISLTTQYTINGETHFDDILFMDTSLFSGGSGSTNDPYIYHDTIVAKDTDLSIVISNISVNVFRCFNADYLNANAKTITVFPVPYDITPIANPNPVCNGSWTYIKANSEFVDDKYQIFDSPNGNLIGSFSPNDSLYFGPIFKDTTIYVTGFTLAGCSYQIPYTIYGDGPCVTDLLVTKSAVDMNPEVNTNINFTIYVKNNGPSNATGVVVTDVLSSAYEFVSASPSKGIWVDPNWNVGDLGWNEEASITIIAKVKPNEIGNYSNTAIVSGNETDPDPLNNTSDIMPDPLQIVDLEVEKSIDNVNPYVGDTVVFTIIAKNNGPSNATGIVVNDPIPSGFTIVSVNTSVGVWNSPDWEIGAFDVGVLETMTITAIVNPNEIGNYTNIANITGNVIDTDLSNNTSEVVCEPIQLADLQLLKTVTNTIANVGDTLEFILEVKNNGISHATGVIVEDVIPNGYNYVSHIASQGDYNNYTGIWNVETVLVDATATLQLFVIVNPPKSNTKYLNVANVKGDQQDNDLSNNTDSAKIIPLQSDIAVTKTVDNNTPQVGGQVKFTITASNLGIDAATNVILKDLLENGFIYVSHEESVGTYNENIGLWDIGTLAVGQTEELTIVAKINTPLVGVVFSNIAEVYHSDQYDPNVSNNKASLVLVPLTADLAIKKSVDIMIPAVGETIKFEILITNNGPSDANNIVVSEQIPNGYTYVSSTVSQGTYDNAIGLWTIGSLTNKATATLSIYAIVNAPNAGVDYRNKVDIVAADEYDPDLTNNSDEVSIISHQSDLEVIKTVNNANPYVGEEIIFTIVAKNNGTHPASGVKVTDVLASGYTFVNSTTTSGTWEAPVWNIGYLAVGQLETIKITAIVNTSGDYSNIAVIEGNDYDQDTTNNISSLLLNPLAVADLAVVKTVNNEEPKPGEEVIFTITATNNGPSKATAVKVTDVIQDGFTFVSALTNIGNWNGSEWTIGDLEKDEVAILDLTVKVNPSGTYVNTANIEGAEYDPDLTNNFSTVSILADLHVPRGFSPNGDGVNDTFIIRGAENYPNNTLVIYNRWGNKVYEASPYINDWDGTSMFGLTYGIDDLPVGTYFFIFDMGDNQGYVKGYVYLSR